MKSSIRDSAVQERMRMTFELYELAEVMQRQNIRRRHPELSKADVEKRVADWLVERRGVEDGDADGACFVRRRILQ